MSNGHVVDTAGWHTVSAISYTDVNKAISQQAAYPTSFEQSASDGTASVSGTFGPWTITTGGSGPNIAMALPITGGTVTVSGTPSTITPCTATIQVRADFLPQPDNSMVQNLQLQQDQAVSVESCLPAQSGFLADASLKQLLQDWLNANLQQFNHTFATVDLDAKYDNEGVKWLAPSWQSYAVAEPQTPTLDSSVFAVLCLIDGTQPSTGLVQQISPYAIPNHADASFLISPDKFLQHMMLASMPLMFVGIDHAPVTNNFKIDNDGTSILNKTKLQLQPMQLENGNIVKPTVDAGNFTLQLDTTELIITVTDMQFTYTPGIDVHLTYSGRSTIRYDSGRGVLTLSVTKQTGSGSVEVSKGLEVTEVVLGVASIVLAMVGGIGGVVSRTANAAVEGAAVGTLGVAEAAGEDAAQAETAMIAALGCLIRGTPAQVSQIAARCFAVAKVAAITAFCTTLLPAAVQVLQAIADGKYDSLPKITDLTDGAVGKTVIWPASVGTFALASAQLNQALQFGLKHAS
jgi:Clostridium P-47 protein